LFCLSFPLFSDSTSTNEKCQGSVNPIISASCSYVTSSAFGSTWAPDGTYSTTISGVSYVINLVSYTDPQTNTLAWKLLVVGEGTMPSTNYMTPVTDVTNYAVTDIANRFTTLETISQFMEFFAGASPIAPLTNNIIQRTNPSLTGITQQAMWLTYDVFKSIGSSVVVRFSLCCALSSCNHFPLVCCVTWI
jgi:hypothetical protein